MWCRFIYQCRVSDKTGMCSVLWTLILIALSLALGGQSLYARTVSADALIRCQEQFSAISHRASVRLPSGYWSEDTVAFWILRMRDAGVDLNHGFFKSMTREGLSRYGIPISPTSFANRAHEIFGSWDDALRYAGLDPAAYRKMGPRVNWSQESVIEEINRLKVDPTRLSSAALKRDKRAYLEDAGRRHFGSWEAALEAAGVRAATIRGWVAWDDGLFGRELWRLNRMGVPLNTASIHGSKQVVDAGDIRYKIQVLHEWGITRYGSWDKALKANGFDPTFIRLKAPKLSDDLRVTLWIHMLKSKGISLNRSDLVQMTRSDLGPLGIPVGGPTLVRMGLRAFGDWDQTLLQAGVHPESVQSFGRWSRQTISYWLTKLRDSGMDVTSESAFSKLTDADLTRAGLQVSKKMFDSKINRLFGSVDEGLVYSGMRTEPGWSIGSVGYWIRKLHEASVPLNSGALQNLTKAELEKMGLPISPTSLLKSGERMFGSWDDALKYAGLDPRAVRNYRASIHWNPLSIISEIENLHRQGVPLNVYTLQRLDAVAGANGSQLMSLYRAAKKEFGSWDNALRAAKLTPRLVRRNVSWKDELFISELKRLHEQGVPLNVNYLVTTGASEMIDNGDVVYSLQALYSRGYARYGNWDNALRAAGIRPHLIRQAQKWNDDLFKREVIRLYRDGIPLNTESLNNSSAKTVIDSEEISYTLNALYRQGRSRYGSWEKAIEAAGLDYRKIAGTWRWKKPEVLDAIQKVAGMGLDLSTVEMRVTTAAATGKLADLPYSLRSLHAAGVKNFGSWNRALEEALLSKRGVGSEIPWNKEMIERELRWTFGEGNPLTTSWFLSVGSKVPVQREGIVYSRAELYRAAIEKYGSWDEAKKSLGLQFGRGRRPSHWMLAEDSQGEWIDGQYVVTLGKIPQTPMEIAAQNSLTRAVEAAMQSADTRAKILYEGLLEYVDSVGSFENVEAVANYLTNYYKRPISANDVRDTLKDLSLNPRLRALFMSDRD